ncbi:hydroxymethylbilane synthase [Aquicella lusitana]|uniref:Porphobilinogen deaminase n=1 Tax=Aquicella lusitana TaxID=254246 RepID=A0A370G699_9COXI|nr:hydroxymethylbilane synthase [Aquicella lusitana]RDI38369.1 hydroxymethylbilane synthase [Aquicella lusitana]VVC72382.1 Porphobilinogen deaminase [Aquicella lusitana]
MTKRHLVIATRESPLALQQAESIKQLLIAHHPHLSVDLLGITTQADKRLDVTLTEIGGKGLFVKELEEALLDGRADIAAHSMKDVPMDLPPGLSLPVMIEREDPRDVFVSNNYASLDQMGSGTALGTSSLRRQTQLRAQRPDLAFENLRGNIHTRLKRLDKGDFDAIVLAAAGLKRMHLDARIRSYLSVEQSLPAAGQGALGIECREEDEPILSLIKPLNHAVTYACVSAERALCRRLGGGCKVPVAAYAQIHHGLLTLHGLVANRNGTRILRVRHEGDPHCADSVGIRAAEELIQQGAEKILKEFID